MPRGRKKKDAEVPGEEPAAAEVTSDATQPGEQVEAEHSAETGAVTDEEGKDDMPEVGEDRPAAEARLAELLGFMLADEEYALDILEIKEIIRPQFITHVPRSPDYLRGIITLRGVIVPVFDLRRRLGLNETGEGPTTRIVIVYRGDELAGLIVDAITLVMRIDVDRIEPPPNTIGVVESEFIKGVTRDKERLVILLNLSRVLDVTA